MKGWRINPLVINLATIVALSVAGWAALYFFMVGLSWLVGVPA